MQLLVRNDPCRSIFRLAGRNEDALTHALGYLLAHDTVLLADFLKSAGVLDRVRGKSYSRELMDARIVLQERRNTGRTDLVIHWSRVRVVVEAKVGAGQPTACQLLHYTTGCNNSAHHGRPNPSPWVGVDRRFIVTLTTGLLNDQTRQAVVERLHSETVGDYASINLRSTTWEDVYHLIRRRADPRSSGPFAWALNEFMTFFREDYEMPYYDAEVLIQDVSGEQHDLFTKFHIYRRDCKGKHAPLYFAPYHTRGGAGVTDIAHCLRVFEDRVDAGLVGRMEAALSTEPKFNQQWPRWREGLTFLIERDANAAPMQRFFFLDAPQGLGKQLKKGPRQTQLPVGFSKTFQELLRDDTL